MKSKEMIEQAERFYELAIYSIGKDYKRVLCRK